MKLHPAILLLSASFISAANADSINMLCLKSTFGLVTGIVRSSSTSLKSKEQALFDRADRTAQTIQLFQAVDSNGKVVAEVKVQNTGDTIASMGLNELLARAYASQGPLRNVAEIKVVLFDASKDSTNSLVDSGRALQGKSILEAYGLRRVSLELSKVQRRGLIGKKITKETTFIPSGFQNGRDYQFGDPSDTSKQGRLEKNIYHWIQERVRARLPGRALPQEIPFNPMTDDIRPTELMISSQPVPRKEAVEPDAVIDAKIIDQRTQ